MSKSRMAGLFQTSAGNPRFGGPLPTIDPRIMAVGPKGYTDYPSLAQERASNRKHAWTTDGANAPPMSRAIEARARTQPVRQIWVGQKLAANGNQIRIAFPEPCFRGKPSAATVRLMLSPSWRRHPRLQPLFGIRQHDGWTALGQKPHLRKVRFWRKADNRETPTSVKCNDQTSPSGSCAKSLQFLCLRSPAHHA
jgi:hypothetical protein